MPQPGNAYQTSEIELPGGPLLGEGEIRRLLAEAKNGSLAARDELVQRNLRLVMSVAQRFAGRGLEIDDLFQIGAMGLLKAISRFNLAQPVRFSTYAVPMIIGEIKQVLRDTGPVKVSRALRDVSRRALNLSEQLMQALGREPSLGEIARGLGLRREEVAAALESTRPLVSLQDTIHEDEGEPLYLGDQLHTDESGFFDRVTLHTVLGKLTKRQQLVVRLRFFQDRTQSDVASLLGVSQVQVSRLEKEALRRLRLALAEKTGD
ncbi:MAG: SigB/SigF/SigG family RNA polymerase sigma factor [Patescibacteria group bacterium]